MRDIRQSPICTIYGQRLQPGSLESQPTAAIIVTAANELLRSVHERMPAILHLYLPDAMTTDPVSIHVNDSRLVQIHRVHIERPAHAFAGPRTIQQGQPAIQKRVQRAARRRLHQ